MTEEVVSYQHAPEFGRQVVKLEAGQLVVSKRGFGALSSIQRFKLSDIERLDVCSERVATFALVPFSYMVVIVIAAVLVLRREWTFSGLIGVSLLYVALLCVTHIVRGMKRHEVVRVVGEGGKTLCEIWRLQHPDRDFEKFVAALQERWEQQTEAFR